jgi:hypothetical protein
MDLLLISTEDHLCRGGQDAFRLTNRADIGQAGSASIFDPRREGHTPGTNNRTRTLLRQPLFFRVPSNHFANLKNVVAFSL